MQTITLNRGQTEALEALREFVAGPGGTFYLAGPAGSGKSVTLAEATRLGVLPSSSASFPVAWCAPSWRAAQVLRAKGRGSADPALMSASSFHAVVYGAPSTELQCTECGEWKGEEEDECAHKWVKALRFNVDDTDAKSTGSGLLIVDESSMATVKMIRDAQAKGWSHILLCGDEYQLPPPTPPSADLRSVLLGRSPDAELTEVMRQALESPVLRAATDVRENGWTRLPAGHELLSRKGGPADIIITGTHNTRIRMNEMVRRQMGLSAMALPRAGEPLVACANYRNLELFNKTEARVVSDGEAVAGSPESWRATISYYPTDRERTEQVSLHRNGLFQPKAHQSAEWSGSAEADRRLRVWLGYAITAHSAQGGEWQNVGIVNEAGMFREHASRWLYVAISRARSGCWVLQ